MARWMLLGIALSACGGQSWTLADAKSATNAALTERAQLALCQEDSGDCRASQVRALAQGALCANASMLAHHGEPVPADAGDGCQP